MTLLPVILTIMGALVGSGGIVFGALRFNRDETGKTVTQHSKILADMESINQHLISELERVRKDLDELRAEYDKLLDERNEYRNKVDSCTDNLQRTNRKVASLEQTITDHETRTGELEALIAQLRKEQGG